MKSFKTHIADKSEKKKKKRFLKKTDYANQDLDLSKLYSLDDIKKSHDPDQVYVSPDASMIIVNENPSLHHIESFSHFMKARQYESDLANQLKKIQSRILKFHQR